MIELVASSGDIPGSGNMGWKILLLLDGPGKGEGLDSTWEHQR